MSQDNKHTTADTGSAKTAIVGQEFIAAAEVAIDDFVRETGVELIKSQSQSTNGSEPGELLQ